jgi:DNA-binding CsgD family transcriptional regulator
MKALVTGRAALDDGRWTDAKAAFEAVLADSEVPEALDGLAEALGGLGEYAASIGYRERAFAAYRARGETRHPALIAAYWLAFEYAAVYGNYAVASGWLERGKRLIESAGDCPERGWVELACAVAAEDLADQERHVTTAMEVARRFGDTDLEFDALSYAGACLVACGQVDEGMRRLDEAVAAARSGEVKARTAVGEIYCKMLVACEMALDVRRAELWTSVAEPAPVWASAICRMHYGGILTAAGRWVEAEDELATSIRTYDDSYRALRSGAVVRLADLRVQQGRWEEAERLLAGHEHDAYAVRPLARLHLERGEVELAATLLRRSLAARGDSVLRVPELALFAEAEVAAGRIDGAEAICGRLRALAEAAPLPLVRAFAAFAAGVVRGAAGDGGARDHFETALAGFGVAGLPLEEARARLALAHTLARSNPQVAVAEARTASVIFERLGARPGADAAAALLRSLGVRGRTGPKDFGVLSKREQEVLQLVGLGLSNPEIADRLFISRKTVSHHVSGVLAKLGLRNRAEAAATYTAQASAHPLDEPRR